MIFIIIKIALDSILIHKLRSFLTVLGIIIGVSSVIIMVAIGNGAKLEIEKQISSIGSNLIIVLPGATSSGGVRFGTGTQMTLTIQDAEALKKESPYIEDTTFSIHEVLQVVYKNMNWSSLVRGTNTSFFRIQEWELERGRFFNEEDIKSGNRVAVIGYTVVKNLFGLEDPIDKTIRIKKIPFKVIGILKEKGTSPRGDDQDDVILVPYTTAQRNLFGNILPDRVRVIYIKARSLNDLFQAENDVKSILRQRHKIQRNQEDDFSVRNITQFLQARQESSRVMTFLLGAIASISLIVGGIGIMNIMLVSVTERTKEIGIRMAVGATTYHIQIQFLIEAILLSIIGSILGILLGIAGAFVSDFVFHFKAILSLDSIIISLFLTMMVGVVFGFYPAYKASLLDPIEALRYE
ncbi:MAG: ABC transporter permease [Leptospiraceae bacterium]|jgi:putative ABC transport system permease protein|nr:ABC transporter permease [Leptospiraceae bacterium]